MSDAFLSENEGFSVFSGNGNIRERRSNFTMRLGNVKKMEANDEIVNRLDNSARLRNDRFSKFGKKKIQATGLGNFAHDDGSDKNIGRLFSGIQNPTRNQGSNRLPGFEKRISWWKKSEMGLRRKTRPSSLFGLLRFETRPVSIRQSHRNIT